MKQLITARLSGTILLIALAALIVFHILILLGALPQGIVWGGQAASSPSNLVTLELVALALTSVFALIVWARLRSVREGRASGWLKAGLWILFAYLLLNLLGNLASGVTAENFIFAPITLVLALLAFRLAVEK